MKPKPKLAAAAALALLALAPCVPPTAAQDKVIADAKKEQKKEQGGAEQKTPATSSKEAAERLEADDTSRVRGDVPERALANRREGSNEDADSEVVYFNNFLTSYRLGPEDVISIKVFGLDRYTVTGVTVPPDGKVDYFHIRDGVHVAGKTTQQVADEIEQHLEEYLIDPKVTVSLEKAMSMRYYVIGDVAQPGIRTMTRRLSAYEAILESGGVLGTGDKSKVTVSRVKADGTRELIPINIAAIEKGKAPDNYFLGAGDLVIVPGNRYKTVKKVLDLLPVVNFFRIFTGGF
ncbi:MAG TPA: polysaccharide biosynthesis/export family protein [Pyrinomonadaceae bacterium]|nr:polysaccharide biosynthesis/export family protein [Pyrinomonadaceae bacterium]